MKYNIFSLLHKRFGYARKIFSIALAVCLCFTMAAFSGTVSAATLGTSSVTIVINKTLRHDTSSPKDKTFTFRITGTKSGADKFQDEHDLHVTRGSRYWYGSITISGLDPSYSYNVSEIRGSNLEGRYDVSNTKSSRTVGSVTTITYEFVNEPSSNNSNSSYNGYSSGSTSSGSSTSGVPSIAALLGKNTETGLDGAAVSSSILTQLDSTAKSAVGSTAAVRVKNASSISPSVLQSMNSTAAKYRKTAVLYCDTMTADGTSVQGRLYVEPAKLTGLTTDLRLGVYVDNSRTAGTLEMFEKTFSNKIAVVSMEQKGAIGARLKVAAKATLADLDTGKLLFYAYDRTTGSYVAINNPEYGIDGNGFVHFYTSQGGEIIITDSALAKK